MRCMTSVVPKGDLSPRQVSLQYGFNPRAVLELLAEGVLVMRGRKITLESLGSLVEGVQYVRCLECGAYAAMIHATHLLMCSGLTMEAYLSRHPGALMLSDRSKERKAKTPEQREAQSKKLKARFQTIEGETTRWQISEAARRMQASESGLRCQEHLRKMGADPRVRAQRQVETRERWVSGEFRGQVQGWHQDNKDLSNAFAARARRGIQQKRTRLHLGFKALMVEQGVTGFVTEYEVGYYSVDEAHPGLKIAVEVDGCWWHSCPECGLHGPPGTLRVDKAKNTYLTNRGWMMIRLWEHEIHRDPMGCISRVKQVVSDLSRSAINVG